MFLGRRTYLLEALPAVPEQRYLEDCGGVHGWEPPRYEPELQPGVWGRDGPCRGGEDRV